MAEKSQRRSSESLTSALWREQWEIDENCYSVRLASSSVFLAILIKMHAERRFSNYRRCLQAKIPLPMCIKSHNSMGQQCHSDGTIRPSAPMTRSQIGLP